MTDIDPFLLVQYRLDSTPDMIAQFVIVPDSLNLSTPALVRTISKVNPKRSWRFPGLAAKSVTLDFNGKQITADAGVKTVVDTMEKLWTLELAEYIDATVYEITDIRMLRTPKNLLARIKTEYPLWGNLEPGLDNEAQTS